jgi:hypothetical protein
MTPYHVRSYLPNVVIVEGEPEYEVEQVLDSPTFRQQLQYLIQWLGWDILTWEYITKVNKLKVINNIYAWYSNKPDPPLEDLD